MTDLTVGVPACKECGGPLTRKKTGPAPSYCSAQCRARFNASKAKADGRYEATLQQRREARSARVLEFTCEHCRETFTTNRLGKKFCSSKCRQGACRDTATKQCEHEGCTKPVRAKSLCIQHYSKTYYPDRSKQWPEDPATKAKRDLIKAKRRRAAMYGVLAENVDREQVGDRDRWVCGICHLKVDKTLIYPHLMSQSLDHIVPLAESGPHTYANTRITHLDCNNRRRHMGGGEQLALIG